MNLLEKKQYVKENLHYLPEEELSAYWENLAYTITKTSSSIEGEIVTLANVISICKGINVGGDSYITRMVYNNFKGYEMVMKHVESNGELTEEFLKDVHEQLLNGIINGGLYRNVDIKIKGSAHTPCSYLKVYDRMAKFFYDINHFEGTPLELAAYTHLQIAKVHPFLDGNGRLARLMLNFQLVKAGYLPISLPSKYREQYFNCLEEFKVNKTTVPFMELLEHRLNREYDRLIGIIDSCKK